MGESDDRATLAFYAERAEVYTGAEAGGMARGLAGFMALLAAGARVLDLGCGGGRDTAAMIAAGFEVEAVDGSPEMAAKAEARLGRAVRVMRFDELDAVAEYDAVWANASLLHVPRGALPGVLGRVHRALRPGGLHFASYKAGGVEGRDTFGRYFNYLTRRRFWAAYGAAWQVVSVSEYMAVALSGPGFPGHWVCRGAGAVGGGGATRLRRCGTSPAFSPQPRLSCGRGAWPCREFGRVCLWGRRAGFGRRSAGCLWR